MTTQATDTAAGTITFAAVAAAIMAAIMVGIVLGQSMLKYEQASSAAVGDRRNVIAATCQLNVSDVPGEFLAEAYQRCVNYVTHNLNEIDRINREAAQQ